MSHTHTKNGYMPGLEFMINEGLLLVDKGRKK